MEGCCRGGCERRRPSPFTILAKLVALPPRVCRRVYSEEEITDMIALFRSHEMAKLAGA